VFADFCFKVNGGGAAYCDMVHHDHSDAVDVVDRGCIDLPELICICLNVAWMMHVVLNYLHVPYFGLMQPSVFLPHKTDVLHNIHPE
jgi:hypothetical protein